MRTAEMSRPVLRTAIQQRQSVLQRPETSAQRQTNQFIQNSSFDCDSISEIVS